MYLKALWIKNSVFIRKLLELMPDLEFWDLIVLQYCSFQLGLYWNALFWSLLLYQCSFVVWSSQDASFFLTESLFLSLHHYWRCKILLFCGCFISSNVLFVFSVMFVRIVIIVCRFICLMIKFYSPCVFSIYAFCMRLSLSHLHSPCV